MKDKKLLISFSGNKADLHKQLKAWCVASEKTMGGTIIELIEELLNAKDINK